MYSEMLPSWASAPATRSFTWKLGSNIDFTKAWVALLLPAGPFSNLTLFKTRSHGIVENQNARSFARTAVTLTIPARTKIVEPETDIFAKMYVFRTGENMLYFEGRFKCKCSCNF